MIFEELLREQCRSVSVSVGNDGSVGTCLQRKQELCTCIRSETIMKFSKNNIFYFVKMNGMPNQVVRTRETSYTPFFYND